MSVSTIDVNVDRNYIRVDINVTRASVDYIERIVCLLRKYQGNITGNLVPEIILITCETWFEN